ncbi:MAG: hypothetical protein ACYDEJ_07245 [Desulfitobacteriaceae bacterium]
MADFNILVPIIDKISPYQTPGKKVLQKLVYLIEKKGLDLGYDYAIHYYGPYCAKLDDAVHSLEMQRLVTIKPEGMSHKIYLTGMEAENCGLGSQKEKLIDEVLKVFASMSAHDLELLTTTDFVARELFRRENTCTDEEIVEGVMVIKGEKFSSEKIHEAITLLKENGYGWN